jgi:TPR repeat protein
MSEKQPDHIPDARAVHRQSGDMPTLADNLRFVKEIVAALPSRNAYRPKPASDAVAVQQPPEIPTMSLARGVIRSPAVGAPQLSESSAARADRARLLLPANTDERFRKIIALNDPKADAHDPDWLNILGAAYHEPSSKHYDLKKAHAYFTKAANLGHGPAAYNLATRWQDGRFGRIDLERARYWFAKGFEYEHGCAGANLAEMMFQDPRFASDHKFRSAAIEVLQRSETMNGLWPPYKMANLLANSGDLDSMKGAIARYKDIAAADADVPPRAFARMCLALRHYLGLGVPTDYSQSLNYLDLANVDDQQASVRYMLQDIKGRLRFILQDRSTPAYENADSREIVQRYDAVFANGTDAKISDSFFLFMAKKAAPSISLSDHLWARTVLAELEGGSSQSHWRFAAQAIQRRIKGVTNNEVHKSTNDFGYIYNERNASGYLVPATSVSPQRPGDGDFYKRSRAPISGLGVVRGLSTTASGQINLRCDEPTSPANTFLTSEDVSVALALAFGTSAPIMPSLSIEDIGKKDAKSPRFFIKQKEWNPAWIGHTQLGKTLYAADYWMARIVAGSSRFYTNGQALDPVADTILQRLALAGGHSDGNWERVMIHPKEIVRTWTGSIQEGLLCQIHSAAIGVVGANVVVHADGTEDRSRNVNDDKYGAGRAANIFTLHYDDIAKVWPVFERTRQLTVLLSLLKELREKGFKPSAALQGSIDATYRNYNGRPAMSAGQLLICKF